MSTNHLQQGKRNEPSHHEQRNRLASVGDLRGLLASIQQAPPGFLEVQNVYAQIQRAICIASERNEREFAKTIYRFMLDFSLSMMFRLQLQCLREIERCDSLGAERGLSDEFLTRQWPLLQGVQLHTSELMQGMASTMRQLELAKRRRPEVDASPKLSNVASNLARKKHHSRGQLHPNDN